MNFNMGIDSDADRQDELKKCYKHISEYNKSPFLHFTKECPMCKLEKDVMSVTSDDELIRLRSSLKRKCNTINKLRDDIDFEYNGHLHTELNELREELADALNENTKQRNKIMILEDDNCMLRGKNKDLNAKIIWCDAEMKDMSEQIEKDQAEISSLKEANYMLVEQRR